MDEIQRVIFQFEGRQKLEELTALLGKESAVLEQIIAQHKQAGVATAAHSQQAQQSAAAIRGYVSQIEGLEKQMRAASAAAGQGVSRFGGGAVNNLAFAVQDFVSTSGGLVQKLNSVTNNLQMIALSMGVGGKVFLGITAGVAAIQLFFANFDKISDWLNGIDRAKMEDAAKKAEDLKKRFEGLKDTPTDQQATVGDIWKKSMEGPNADAVRKGVYESLFKSPFGSKMTPEDQAAITEAGRRRLVGGGPLSGPGMPESDAAVKARVADLRKQIANRINAENAKLSAEMVAQASMPGPQGDAARRQIDQMRAAVPGAFPKGFNPTRDVKNAEDKAIYDASGPGVGPPLPPGFQRFGQEPVPYSNFGRSQARRLVEIAGPQPIQQPPEARQSGFNALERRASARASEVPVGDANQVDMFQAQSLAQRAMGLVDVAAADTAIGLGGSESVQLLNQIVTKLEWLAARNNNAGMAQMSQQIQALYARQSNLMGGGAAPMEPMLWGGF